MSAFLIAPAMVIWGVVAVAVVAGVFWQSSKAPPTDRYDPELPLSSFGSHGRLFAVDATLSAIDRRSAASVVSLCCRDGVVTVYTTTRSPYIHSKELVVESVGGTSPSQFVARLDSTVDDDGESPPLAVAAGTGVDQILLRSFIQEMAEKHLVERNSASAMSRRLADALQLRTQQPATGRLLVASCLFLDSQCIWKIDASGQFWKQQGGAIGRHAPKIEQFLREATKSIESADDQDIVDDTKERIANLTFAQALALARDSILLVYEQSNATSTANDDKDDELELRSVRIQGFVLGRHGQRVFDHDSLLSMSIDNDR